MHTTGQARVILDDDLKTRHLMIGRFLLATVPGGVGDPLGIADSANAKRLAACWNACAGIHVDILTAHDEVLMGPVGLVDMPKYNTLLHKLDRAREALQQIAKAHAKTEEGETMSALAAEALKEIIK